MTTVLYGRLRAGRAHKAVTWRHVVTACALYMIRIICDQEEKMPILHSTTKLTVDEFLSLPETDEHLEIVDGEIVMSPSPKRAISS